MIKNKYLSNNKNLHKKKELKVKLRETTENASQNSMVFLKIKKVTCVKI